MTVTASAAYQPRGKYPLVMVFCTGCGEEFQSGAHDHTTCPVCRRNLRVHRAGRGRRLVTVRVRPAPAIRTVSVRQAVRQAPVFPPILAAPPVLAAPPIVSPADDDDDGYAYVPGPDGRLVLAEQKDGRVVPATRLPEDWLAPQLRVRRWRLRAHGQGICQVERALYVPADSDLSAAEWLECPYRAAHDDPVVCETHWAVLQSPVR